MRPRVAKRGGGFWPLGAMPAGGGLYRFVRGCYKISLVAGETMIARRARIAKRFTHVANLVLRGVLESSRSRSNRRR